MATKNFLEKDLETIIFETDNELLRDRGLPIYGTKKRQLSIGNYGVADIVTLQREDSHKPCIEYIRGENTAICKECVSRHCEITEKLTIQIFELKLNEINTGAFLQALRYSKGIKRYFGKRRKISIPINFEIILCGNYVKKDDIIYISDFCNNLIDDEYTSNFTVKFYSYSYNYDGISFKEESEYFLINEGF